MATSATSPVKGDRCTYEGGRNVVYDLTGGNEEFFRVAEYIHYQQGTQDLELPVPVYIVKPLASTEDALATKVYLVTGDVAQNESQVTRTPLTYVPQGTELSDNEWTIEEVDQTATAKALLLWNRVDTEFNGVLARRLRICLNDPGNKRLRIEFQMFFKDMIDSEKFAGQIGPYYTRELGQAILDRIDDLDARTTVITRNLFGKTTRNTDTLLVDLTGSSADNYVQHELHDVNTAEGKTLLAPAMGAFYPGLQGERTEFKMFKYAVITETIGPTHIAEGSRNGWLFIYTTNRIKVYKLTKDEVFYGNTAYYKLNPYGGYDKLAVGVDYNVGDSISEFSTDVFNLTLSKTTEELANFDSSVNDTSAIITQEHRVILTPENINDYYGLHGQMVDITCSLSDSKELVKGVDYEFCDVDLEKTERSYSDQPVYNHIRLLQPLITDDECRVGICYQAFGGAVTAEDIRGLKQDMTNLMAVLAEHHLMTVESLEKNKMIKEMWARIRRMESYHDHFAQVDHVVHKDNTGFHWINIATIYDLGWFTDLQSDPIKEIGTFRVASRDQGWCYEFTVTVDLSKDTAHCLSVKTLGAKGVDLNNLESWYSLPVKERLGVRLCWNDEVINGEHTNGKQSGLVLQLGWDYSNYNFDPETDVWDVDTVTVTNKSGNTSMFRLYSNPLELTLPTDEADITTYGHVSYKQFTGTTTGMTCPFYEILPEYVYFLTGDYVIAVGKTYYEKNDVTGEYEESAALPGTPVSELGAIYERQSHRAVYRRLEDVPTTVTEDDGIYVVDDTKGHDDDDFSFVNPEHVWEHEKNPDKSKCSTMYIEDNAGGLTVWLGNIPVKAYSFGPQQELTPIDLVCCLTKEDQVIFDADSITSASVLVYDRKVGRYITSSIPMCSTGEGKRKSTGDGIFFFEDMCGISLTVEWLEDEDRYRILAEVGVGTSSWVNDRFDLRQIKLHF